MSDRYARLVISVRAESEGDATFTLVKNIRACAEKYYPGEWYLAGEGVSTCDLMDTITSDMAKVNLVAIGAVFFALPGLLYLFDGVFIRKKGVRNHEKQE